MSTKTNSFSTNTSRKKRRNESYANWNRKEKSNCPLCAFLDIFFSLWKETLIIHFFKRITSKLLSSFSIFLKSIDIAFSYWKPGVMWLDKLLKTWLSFRFSLLLRLDGWRWARISYSRSLRFLIWSRLRMMLSAFFSVRAAVLLFLVYPSSKELNCSVKVPLRERWFIFP